MAKTYNLSLSFNEVWLVTTALNKLESDKQKDSDLPMPKKSRRSQQQELIEIKNLRAKLIESMTKQEFKEVLDDSEREEMEASNHAQQ